MQFIVRAGLIAAGLIGAGLFGEAGAETGESADDTSIYKDTGAQAERVFVQDVGCGSAAVALPLVLGALFLPRRRDPS